LVILFQTFSMHRHTHVRVVPLTASACVNELDRIQAVVDRMRDLLSADPTAKRHTHVVKHKLNCLDFSVEALQSESEVKPEAQRASYLSDSSDDFNWDKVQAQLTLKEDIRTSPLIDALKKVEWRARDRSEIAKWCSELATLFFKADRHMNGRIEEDDYVCLINSLPLSTILKEDLCVQFSSIDLTGSGDVTLEEFLYFFLSFPPFKKELASSFHVNEPYHKFFGNVATWRKVRLWVFNVITVPGYNTFSKVLFCLDLLLAFVPFIMLYIELINPNIHPEKMFILWFMVIFFATQWVIGLVTCKSKIKYLVDRVHIAELISFLPWMIYNSFQLNDDRELPSSNHPFFVGSHGAIGFFLVRITKIVNLPSVFPSSSWLQEDIDIYMQTIHLALASYKPLGWFMFFLIMFLSTLIYAFERGEYNGEIWERYSDPGESSPFSNFFNCVWFTLVTGTTLGYGDFYPKSYEGKLVGMLIVVIGLVNITIVINTIGECFEEIFRTFLENKSKKIKAERAHYIKNQVKLAERKVEELQKKHSKSKLGSPFSILSSVGSMLSDKSFPGKFEL